MGVYWLLELSFANLIKRKVGLSVVHGKPSITLVSAQISKNIYVQYLYDCLMYLSLSNQQPQTISDKFDLPDN